MKKLILLLILIVIAQSKVFGCDYYFKSEELCMDVKWEVFPAARTNGTLLLTFSDPKDATRLINPKLFPHVVLWMTSMGHGSKPVTLQNIEVGQFKSTDVFFVMGGPWDIKYQLKDGNTVTEEFIQKVKI